MAMDLNRYFQRIGYHGVATPTLDTLNAIILAHTKAIAFENVDVLLGRPIAIDEEALWDKLVVRKRGGYCFEQNGLLLLVLQAMGFVVTALSARVRVDRERTMTPPRTHVFLQVTIDGDKHFADVGVGGMTPTCALPMPRTDGSDAGTVLTTPHEPRRFSVVDDDDGGPRRWFQQALRNDWRDVCEFTLEPMPMIDRELANWFTSAHPKSHFKNRLVVARTDGVGRRYTLLNRDLMHRRPDGITTTRVDSQKQLRDVLSDVFGLHVEANTELQCEGLNWHD
jgi:N-hydroxyarylamine O-acetyltransferase